MNTDSPVQPPSRATRCFRRFWRFALGLVLLVAGVATFYAYENWQGERAWEKFNNRWLADATSMGMSTPELVPDEENFAKAPGVRDGFAPDTNAIGPGNPMPTLNSSQRELLGCWHRSLPTDLTEWRNCFRPTKQPAWSFFAEPDDALIVPEVVFNNVPLREVIDQLAREAKLRYQTDPDLSGLTNGQQTIVSFRWEKVTHRQALEVILHNHGFEFVRMENTPVLRLTRAVPPSPVWPFEVCDITTLPLPASADQRISPVTVDELPCRDVIRILARQTGLNYLTDPSLTSALSMNYSLALTNVTLREVWARVLTDWGVALTGGGETGIYRIIRAPPAPKFSPAAAVLAHFAPFEEQFHALYAACERHHSQISTESAKRTRLRGLGEALTLHGSAQLSLGDSQAALQDATVLVRLREGLSGQDSLLSANVETGLTRLYLQLVWEGLASRRWKHDQLLTLEQQLKSLDLLVAYQQGYRAEQARLNTIMENTPRAELAAVLAGNTAPRAYGRRPPFWVLPLECALRWGPRGWLRQMQVVYAEENEGERDMFDAAAHRLRWVDREQRCYNWKRFAGGSHSLGAWFGKLTVAYSYVGREVGQVQTGVIQARVACALERYRQGHGHYPDFLSELVPEFIERLPHDLTTGHALNYRPTHDGQFVLYSAGLDGQDNAAAGDDWVWRYPAS